MVLHELSSKALFDAYNGKEIKCDGCGKRLAPEPEETWAKAGCGYFCADCLAKGVHLTAPCALR